MAAQRATDFHESGGKTPKGTAKHAAASTSPLRIRDRLRATYVLGAVLVSTAYVFLTDEEVRNDLMSIFER